VARIAQGIGMEVIGWNRTKHADITVPLVEIDELLERSDVVSMNLTLGGETRGFLDAARIARIKKGAIFINTARGALVDEAALIAALTSGQISHAGMDVFLTEPLPATHPFTRMDNVTITAHSAFRTLEASMTLLRRAIDIVKSISA
jgi:D-3-phosphoglycerate dehydrogenase / 2-oxoglutarate reductase